MDITCPRCQAEYEFDDRQVTDRGITVKCTACDHVFRVRRRAVAEVEEIEGEEATRAQERRWQIRTVHGEVLEFEDRARLQHWIASGRVGRNDQISRSGTTWKRLGDIRELVPLFDAAAESIGRYGAARYATDEAETVVRRPHLDPEPEGGMELGTDGGFLRSGAQRAPGTTGPQLAGTDAYARDGSAPDFGTRPASSRESSPYQLGSTVQGGFGDRPGRRHQDAEEPAFAAPRGGESWRGGAPLAAWEQGSYGPGSPEDDEDFIPVHRPVRMLILVMLVLAIVASGVYAAFYPQVVKRLATSVWAKVMGRVNGGSETYRRARRLFLMDDEASLERADELLAEERETDPARVSALRAEILGTWAQHLREQAQIFERRAQHLEASGAAAVAEGDRRPSEIAGGGEGAAGKEEPSAARGKRSPEEAEALAAKVRVLRLRATALRDEAKKKLDKARVRVERSVAEGTPESVEIYRAMADVRRLLGRDREAVLQPLRRAEQLEPGDPETRYVRAMVTLAHGTAEEGLSALRQAAAKAEAALDSPLLRAEVHLALLYLQTERLLESRRHVQRVLASNPDHGLAQSLLAQVEGERRDSGEGQGKAPRGDKTGVPAADGGGSVDARVEAAQISGNERAARPSEAEVGADTSARAGEQGQAPEAERGGNANRPSGVRPREVGYDALVRSGDRLLERGRTMRALRVYEEALERKPAGVEAITGVGYCQLDLARFSQAIAQFKRALRIASTYGDAMIGLAEAYKALGDKERALDYYRAYLKAAPGGPKSRLARQNVRDLEPEVEASEPTEENGDATPPAARVPPKPRAAPPRRPGSVPDRIPPPLDNPRMP